MKAALKYVGKSRYTLEDLKEIITILRAPDGCPWDREQTHESNRRNFLEEAYEAAEAFDLDDPELMKEELGDVLFAAVKVGRFCGVDPEAALSKTCEKFIARFRKVEETVNARGEDMSALPLDELMALWNNAKEQLR